MHGARPTLLIGVAVTVFALLIALVFGLLVSYYGGILDTLIARLTDIFFGLPFVLGATVILVAFPSHGVWAMTLVLVLLGWTTMIRIMRGRSSPSGTPTTCRRRGCSARPTRGSWPGTSCRTRSPR